jgi:phage regulator Rha-like protein
MRNPAILEVENFPHENLTNQNNVVHVAHGKPFTTSLVIAEQCGLDHANSVIRLIRKYETDLKEFGLLVFQIQAKQKGKRGGGDKTYAELNEDQATYLITLFENTPIVRKFKLALVKAFRKVVTELQRIQSDPNRANAIDYKRDSAKFMTDALTFIRDMADKKTEPRHYTNEHLFCNRALTGKWGKLDESTLDAYDVKLLAAIRIHNANLIHHYPKQSDRKELMDKFVADYRAKHPNLKLIEGNATAVNDDVITGGLAHA